MIIHMIRLFVRYSRPADLVADFETQFQEGGLLVRVEPPAGAKLFDDVELQLETLAGRLVLPAQIVQIVAGAGVALTFDASDADLLSAIDEARGAGELAGPPPEHGVVADEGISDPPGSAPSCVAAAPLRGAAAKVHTAMHGTKEERMRIMREGDRSLHHYVLRNPGLQLDEITAIAKMSTVAPDLLKAITDRREWIGRPEIALALVRNPKCPVPLAIRMLQHVGAADLRRLAKGGGLRMQILQAARKIVVG